MKKIFLNFAGNDQYEEVGGQKGTKWDFNTNAICECILMDRKRMKSSQPGGKDYDMYSVIHKASKGEFVIFCNSVLEDRLKTLPLYSAVKISFLGKHPTKKYHQFSVGFDKNFKFNPADWQTETQYNNVPAADPLDQYQKPAAPSAGAGVSNDNFEDAPF